jgi:hypothetical protein
VAAPWVVPAFDEVEDGEPRLRLSLEPAAIEEFALEGREEALAQRVVVRVADAAHRRPDAGFVTSRAEGHRRVLPKFNRSSQHRTKRGCDDDTKKAVGTGRTSETTLARPALGSAA